MQSVPATGGSSSDIDRQAASGGDGHASDPTDTSDRRGAGAHGEALKQAIVVDTEKVRGHLDEMVRSTVEATLNQMLDEEADRIAGVGKYERSAERKDTRAGSYQRKLQTKAGEVEVTVPRLRKLPLETSGKTRHDGARLAEAVPCSSRESPAETPRGCVKTVRNREQPAAPATAPSPRPVGI